jgi:hypothetical protein
MAKLDLKAAPTFPAMVPIPVAGGDDVLVQFIFKHKTRSEFIAFASSREGVPDVDSAMEMLAGWELDAPFNQANLAELFEQRIGSPAAIYSKYRAELTKARLGN